MVLRPKISKNYSNFSDNQKAETKMKIYFVKKELELDYIYAKIL